MRVSTRCLTTEERLGLTPRRTNRAFAAGEAKHSEVESTAVPGGDDDVGGLKQMSSVELPWKRCRQAVDQLHDKLKNRVRWGSVRAVTYGIVLPRTIVPDESSPMPWLHRVIE